MSPAERLERWVSSGRLCRARPDPGRGSRRSDPTGIHPESVCTGSRRRKHPAASLGFPNPTSTEGSETRKRRQMNNGNQKHLAAAGKPVLRGFKDSFWPRPAVGKLCCPGQAKGDRCGPLRSLVPVWGQWCLPWPPWRRWSWHEERRPRRSRRTSARPCRGEPSRTGEELTASNRRVLKSQVTLYTMRITWIYHFFFYHYHFIFFWFCFFGGGICFMFSLTLSFLQPPLSQVLISAVQKHCTFIFIAASLLENFLIGYYTTDKKWTLNCWSLKGAICWGSSGPGCGMATERTMNSTWVKMICWEHMKIWDCNNIYDRTQQIIFAYKNKIDYSYCSE